MLDYGDLYHAGIVVPQLERGMAELGEQLGVSFPAIQTRTFHLWTPGGDLNVPLRFAYSRQGPPYVELIEAAPNSPWALADDSAIHHLGIFVEDLEGEIARLTKQLGTLETRFLAPDGSTTVCYVNSGLRTRLELVDVKFKEPILAMTRD